MGDRNSDWKCNWGLDLICKIGMESVKDISKGYSGEYVCRIGHIEVGGRQMGLIYFLASSNNSPGIKNSVVLVCGDIVDDEECSFPIVKL